jgi:hypothetical protein
MEVEWVLCVCGLRFVCGFEGVGVLWGLFLCVRVFVFLLRTAAQCGRRRRRRAELEAPPSEARPERYVARNEAGRALLLHHTEMPTTA